MAEQALQSRLDAVFGALGPEREPSSWKPAAPVFRTGAILDQEAGSSEEEEFEERARREVVPGLAMDLAAEDEPDAEGFKPSTAFCRALDKEEEYNDVDEMATGSYRSRGQDALPPRNMEVLDDNIWEQRVAQQEALQHAGGVDEAAAMDTDARLGATTAAGAPGGQEQREAPQEEGGQEVAAATGQRVRGRSSSGGSLSEGVEGSPRPALASAARAKGGAPKRVRFQGVPQPWVPPHRREGYVPRDPEDVVPPPPGQPSANTKPHQRGIAQSRVPDHVQHPEKYTLYTLDEPLVVGGGLGQLGAAESQAQLERAAAAAIQPQQGEAGAEAAEPARWQGAVGGGIEFRPRAPKPCATATDNADVDMAGPGASGSGRAAAPVGAAVRLSVATAEEEEGREEVGAAGREGGQPGSGAEDSEMADAGGAAGSGAAQFKTPRGGRSGRGYRSKPATGGEEEA